MTPESSIPSPTVFIAYAREWKFTVDRIYLRLREAGCRPWLDGRDIPTGTEWHDAIMSAIAEVDVILVCVSRQFEEKERFVLLEMEAACARVGKAIVLPVMLEPEAAMPVELADLQWVNYYLPGGFGRLVADIDRFTNAGLRAPLDEFPWQQAGIDTADLSPALLSEMAKVCEQCLTRFGDMRLANALGQGYEVISAVIQKSVEPLRSQLRHDIEITCLDGRGRYVLHPWPSLIGQSFASQWEFKRNKGPAFVAWYLGLLATHPTGYAVWIDDFHSSQDMEIEMVRSKLRYRRKTAVLFSQVHVAKNLRWSLSIEGHEIAGIDRG